MRLRLFIVSVIALTALYSCDDDQGSDTGTLSVRYETTGNWTPKRLDLYSANDPFKVIHRITTEDLKPVELSLPPGKYILKREGGDGELRFTIEKGKTVKVYYHKKTLAMEN